MVDYVFVHRRLPYMNSNSRYCICFIGHLMLMNVKYGQQANIEYILSKFVFNPKKNNWSIHQHGFSISFGKNETGTLKTKKINPS